MRIQKISCSRVFGAEQLAQFSSHLKVVALGQGELIADRHGNVRKVYFPHSGIISCIVEMKEGHAIETAMIGNHGAFGTAQALDDKVSMTSGSSTCFAIP